MAAAVSGASRDDDDYQADVRDCWINPVKHGFVARDLLP